MPPESSPAEAGGIYRPNVAAVITNAAGRVLICERTGFAGSWQFPQGGLDPGEDAVAGLIRELREELSLEPGDYRVGKSRGPYRYLFAPGRTKGGFRGQEQLYFQVEMIAPDARIDLATADHEFQAFRWIDPAGFDLRWLPEMKWAVYKEVFRDFFAVSLPLPDGPPRALP